MYWSVFFFFLVLLPLGLPHGSQEGLPPAVFPSPPPKGWSIGFVATPLTDGLIPKCLFAPALPNFIKLCLLLPTSPIVALQYMNIFLISPERSLIVAYLPSLANN